MEILFRGKRTSDGEWVYGYYAPTGWVNGEETDIPVIITDAGELYEVHENTVSQFAGLCDIVNMEIFGGDIVKINDDREEIGTIEWDADELEWQLVIENICTKLGNYHSDELEVIGNKFDEEVEYEDEEV